MKKIFSSAITRIILLIILFLALIWLILRFSPYPQLGSFAARPGSVRYYDRNGILLQITPLENGLRREITQEIPPQLKDVFVFAEDRRFFSHIGVDVFSLARALFQNAAEGRTVSGASTITMQLARMIADNASSSQTHSAGAQSVWDKIHEMINALRLETRLSKNEILDLYLNSLPFGFNVEGVTSAARFFFSTEISMLSPAQIFALAVIPRRPAFYNPLENPSACMEAASALQQRFAADRKLREARPLFAELDEDNWNYAAASARRFSYPFELPHLIRFLNASEAFGHTAEAHLTIDLALQHYLEGAIAGNVTRYYSSRITNGAAVVIDNKTGEILAWVGSADFFNSGAAGQIDGVLALNQPGSSMKPFLYALALEYGFKPTDVLADIQMSFGENELYIPRNFNERFNGPMLFRSALASSLNIPAVYLLYRVGVRNYTDFLLSLGFDSLASSAQDAGLGLALGNAPVSLFELARAFSVFARDGVFLPLVWQLPSAIDDNNSFYSKEENRIFSADTSRLICSFLSDSNARVLAFGSASNFRTAFPAIFKTGTANQYQSITALGATPGYTAAVWMGNFTGETVMGRTGSSIPAAIARDTLALLEGRFRLSNEDFPEPENYILKRVCSVSGMLPSDACLSLVNEYMHKDDPGSLCTWHRIINGRSQVVFPAEYQSWFNAYQRQGELDYSSRPLEIITPRDGFSYLVSPGIGIDEIPVEVIGGEEEVLRVTHNGAAFSVSRPFVFYLQRIPGANTLRVQNGSEQAEVIFTVE